MLNLPIRQKITIMLAVMSGMMLAALDQTIVATALPRIVSQLHGLKDLSWVVTAYLLTSTITLPISGKLSDIYGRKKLLLIGILVFVAGSMLSGLSQNMPELIGFRALQGIGAGLLMSNAFAVIGDLFTPKERGRWQGIVAGVFGLASVIGPLLGGYLTDHASWRWIFYVNVPVGVLAFFLITTFMPHINTKAKQAIDYLGAALLAGGLSSLLLAMVWGGNQYAWSSAPVITAMAAAVALLGSFGWVEHRRDERAILPLDLFKSSIFSLSMLIVFLIGVAMFGAILYIPLFSQDVLGRTATNSGVILTPLILSLVAVSVIVGQVVSRTGRYKAIAIAGTAAVTSGIFWLGSMGVHTTGSQMTLRMIVIGLGLGAGMPIFNLVVQNAFSQARLGVVTASVQMFRTIGATIGVAAMGSILNNSLARRLAHGNGSPTAYKAALSSSISEVFIIAGGVVSIAFVASWFLKEIPLRSHHDEAFIETTGEEVGASGSGAAML